MINTKPWYKSKIVWAGVVVTLLGIFPLVNIFVRAVAPQVVSLTEAIIALVAGILTVIWRIWFTDSQVVP